MYKKEIKNNNKSDDPLINNDVSDIIWLYLIHKEDEIIFITENNNEYGLVDFFVYNKYMNTNLPDIEKNVAGKAIDNSGFMYNLNSKHLS